MLWFKEAKKWCRCLLTWLRCAGPIWAGPFWRRPAGEEGVSFWRAGWWSLCCWWSCPVKRCCCIWPGVLAGYWSAPQSEEDRNTTQSEGCRAQQRPRFLLKHNDKRREALHWDMREFFNCFGAGASPVLALFLVVVSNKKWKYAVFKKNDIFSVVTLVILV